MLNIPPWVPALVSAAGTLPSPVSIIINWTRHLQLQSLCVQTCAESENRHLSVQETQQLGCYWCYIFSSKACFTASGKNCAVCRCIPERHLDFYFFQCLECFLQNSQHWRTHIQVLTGAEMMFRAFYYWNSE